MSGRLDLDLSGVTLRLEGVSRGSHERLSDEWSAFRARAAARPFLHARVRTRDAHDGSPTPHTRQFAPKQMRSRLTAERAVFSMPEGQGEVDASGRCRIELAPGLGDREFFTLVNLLRACLAWRLPSRGSALLHAAGLVVESRAFVLVGAEGSGKSTFARLGEQSGARVISDDLVLLDSTAGQIELLGAPFRSTHPIDFRRGRWPLAAVLFPRHGRPAALAATAPLVAKARILANLPFIAEGVESDPRIESLLARLSHAAPCLELTFAPDPSFIELLRG